MEPTLQNRPAANQQEEKSAFEWLGEVSSATLDGLKSVIAPGFSAASSLLGAATRACYWLGEQNWKSIFGGTKIDLGQSEEAKKLSETWEQLRESAPRLDRLGARLEQLSELIEKTPKGSTEYSGLCEQRDVILKRFSEQLASNAPKIHQMHLQHEALLGKYIEELKNSGMSVEEIEQKVNPLRQSKQRLDEVVEQTRASITQIRQYVAAHQKEFSGCLEENEKIYNSILREHNIQADPKVEGCCSTVGHNHHKRLEAIIRVLDQAEKKLEKGDIDESFLHLKDIQSLTQEHLAQTQKEVDSLIQTRNSSLLSSGLGEKVLSAFAHIDHRLREIVKDFAEYIVSSLKLLNDCYDEIYTRKDDFFNRNMQILRMDNAAYYGGAGSSALSLGLFQGPYAVSVLSYVDQQVKLEKLAAKMHLLAPPPTLEEVEEYRKIS